DAGKTDTGEQCLAVALEAETSERQRRERIKQRARIRNPCLGAGAREPQRAERRGRERAIRPISERLQPPTDAIEQSRQTAEQRTARADLEQQCRRRGETHERG